MSHRRTANSIDIDRTRGDFRYPEQHEFDAGIGLTPATRSTTSPT